MSDTILEQVCEIIPATPEVLLQWMTHVIDANDDTFAIICVLVDTGYNPDQVVLLNELNILLGVENVIPMARKLSPEGFMEWVSTLNKLNLTMAHSVMLTCIIKQIDLFDRIKTIESDNK